jgi:uncharacterized protein
VVTSRLVLTVAIVTAMMAAACRSTGSELPPPARPLPGAEPLSAELQARLRAALAAKGPTYRPRSRHLRPDGTPRYTNRLILESSPYLLQHAHNPVNWYPWGDEAFARALAEERPVLLSVGYSTCHWCHVMEEESFEDEEIAAYLNTHYVAIKVDREERPDVDEAYMTVVQLLTGGGGWPMTVWLTPERDAFFGGTYFPARDGDRGASVGFLSLLQRLRATFDADPQGVAARAAEITARVRSVSTSPAAEGLPDPAILRRAFEQYVARFDVDHGGFGGAPKFPSPAALAFLLRYHRRTAEARALSMVTRTLEAMAAGGVYDHVGGGFHRYATDAAWLVPHFEKMLYDNAQLASVYLEAFQVTKREEFARVTRDILDYLLRDMRAPGGGFLTASDADSDGREGRFYVWTPDEIAAVLDPAHAAAVRAYYGVTAEGNFDGATILHVSQPLTAVAEDLATDPQHLRALLDEARETLRTARAKRVPPATDGKVLAGWNGLAISAFARAGAVLDEPRYVDAAREAAQFVLARMRPGGRLRRSFAAGAAHQDGVLDDHVFLAAAFLDLYEATFDSQWLREAVALQKVVDERFADTAAGGYFLSAAGEGIALVRSKPSYDGAVPSGNSVAAETLLRLAEYSGNDEYRRRAAGVFRALARDLARGPTGSPRLLAAYEFFLDRPREIVIVRSAEADADDGAALLATVHASFVPNRMLAVVSEGRDLEAQERLIPLLAEKRALGGRSTAYVCEQGACELPTSDPEVLARQLAKVYDLPSAERGRD